MEIDNMEQRRAARTRSTHICCLISMLGRLACISLIAFLAVQGVAWRAEAMNSQSRDACLAVETPAGSCDIQTLTGGAAPDLGTDRGESAVVALFSKSQQSVVSRGSGNVEYGLLYVMIIIWVIVLTLLLAGFLVTGNTIFLQMFLDVLTLGITWVLRLLFGFER